MNYYINPIRRCSCAFFRPGISHKYLPPVLGVLNMSKTAWECLSESVCLLILCPVEMSFLMAFSCTQPREVRVCVCVCVCLGWQGHKSIIWPVMVSAFHRRSAKSEVLKVLGNTVSFRLSRSMFASATKCVGLIV